MTRRRVTHLTHLLALAATATAGLVGWGADAGWAVASGQVAAPRASAQDPAPATASLRDGRDPDLPPSSDLMSLRVADGPRVLRITLRLRRLDPDRTSAYALLSTRHHPDHYSVGTDSSGHGHHPVLVRFGSEDSVDHLRCRGLVVALDRSADAVRIRVPQRCVASRPGDRIRVEGLTEVPGDGSDQDSTRSLLVGRG